MNALAAVWDGTRWVTVEVTECTVALAGFQADVTYDLVDSGDGRGLRPVERENGL